MSILEQLIVNSLKKITPDNHQAILEGLLRIASSATTDKQKNIIESEVIYYLGKGAKATPTCIDSAMKTWPTLASMLIAHGGAPTIKGFSELAHHAISYIENKEIHDWYDFFESEEDSIEEYPLIWDWIPVVQTLIQLAPERQEWLELVNYKKDMYVISWIGTVSRTLETDLIQKRKELGLITYPDFVIPHKQKILDKKLYQAIKGIREYSETELSPEEQERWISLLMSAGAQANTVVSNEEPKTSMARAIYYGNQEMVTLLKSLGAAITWKDIFPSIKEKIHIAIETEHTSSGDFTDEKERNWFLKLIAENIPLDFDWNIRVDIESEYGTFEENVSDWISKYQHQIDSYTQALSLENNTHTAKNKLSKKIRL